MCGICGFVGTGTREDLIAMNNFMVHRGPDASGHFIDAERRVHLGHRRLSIIDLVDGAQPMTSAHGNLVITFNGEIYNHQELRTELEKAGHRFRSSHSDTEVLLHGYQQWGDDLPQKLNGMWAFAVYDKQKRSLFLSRDRFGKKPLYYICRNGLFAFASELSALTQHPRIEKTISIRSLQKYFAYGYIPAPNSFYENIQKLPGGCSLRLFVDDLSTMVTRYWRFELEPFDTIPRNPEETWGEELRTLLDRAVERRLMSDVPLGIFLSGGIDSTAVSYYAARHRPPSEVKTFSIGFDDPSFDETSFSSFAAHHLGTDHHHAILSSDTALTLLPLVREKLDEPMGDSSLLPTYLLCKETRKHVTVALGGDGADELFAGYDPFRALHLAEAYSRMVPRPLHQAIRMIAARLPTSFANMSLDFRLKRTLLGLSFPKKLWTSVWQGPLDPVAIGDLFGNPVNADDLYSEAIEQWDNCKQKNIVDKALTFYTNLYLQDDILVKIDRASMMNSLEVRAPFLDIDLVNFARRIPASYKYRNGETKFILKKALEPVLPKEIVYRSKKGFGVPVGQWFGNGNLTINSAHTPPVLDHTVIDLRLANHRIKKTDERPFLWNTWLLANRRGGGNAP